MKRYQWLAGEIGKLIDQGVIRAGERVPSIRRASSQFEVSPGTVLQAYMHMEQDGLISPRPHSGYYVRSRDFGKLPLPHTAMPPGDSTDVDVTSVIYEIWDADTQKGTIRLGSLFPDPELLPLRQLNRLFGRYVRSVDPFIAAESIPPGSEALRREISRRHLANGCQCLPDEITITEGQLDAMNLCLSAVANAGDTVVTTAPCFASQLLALENHGLKVVQIPVDPKDGPSIEKLEEAIRQHEIAGVLLMTNFHNPVGCTMQDERKRALVELLAEHEIPLIEDDSNGELAFDNKPRRPAKVFDKKGLVLYFSTFSTWLALGHKVGWIAAGRYMSKVLALQYITALSPSAYSQLAISRQLTHGAVKRDLQNLRATLQMNLHALTDLIRRDFPAGTCVSRPDGGYFLWVEFPQGVETLTLYKQMRAHGMSIAPGPMFCPRGTLRNFVRLNYGHVWDEKVEACVRELGRLAKKQLH